jgi:pimeloyl-ACP methyl ester carboxylesterase
MNPKFGNQIALWAMIGQSLFASPTQSFGREPTFTSAGISSGLVGFWPLNGNAADESGNRNMGTPLNLSPTSDRFGNANGAFHFAGNRNSYVRIASSPTLNVASAITVAAWINYEVGGTSHPRILHKGVYELFTYATTENRRLAFAVRGVALVATATEVLRAGRWFFVAATYDGSVMRLYVDGTLAADTRAAAAILSSSTEVNLGRNAENMTDNYRGTIDDVRIYNRALSEAEIRALYHNLGPAPAVPLIVPTSRIPDPSQTTLVKPTSDQLKVFDSVAFTSGVNLDRSKMTVVLTHGWMSGPSAWPTAMAEQLASTMSNINIVAWDWSAGAGTGPLLDLARASTCPQGEALGKALYQSLGADYERQIHLIGHSLGTLVNASAADYLHGDASRKPSQPYDPARTHVTLLDEAEVANIEGQLIQLGIPLYGDLLALACPYRSPIPRRTAWVDNYFSFAGNCHDEAVNVYLPRGITYDLAAWHGYPSEWYGDTIDQPTAARMGYRYSFERNDIDAPYAKGTVLSQDRSSSQPLDLVPVSASEANIVCGSQEILTADASGILKVVTGGIQAAGNVAADVVVDSFVALHSATSPVQILTDWSYRFILRRIGFAGGLSEGGAPVGGQSSSASSSYAWVPVTIPRNAIGMSFRFRFENVGDDEFFAVGISNINLFTIEGRFIQQSNWVGSGVLNISHWADQPAELFFGVSGDTAATSVVEIGGIQFYTASTPRLEITKGESDAILSWPFSAIDYALEMADGLSASNRWQAVTNPAVTTAEQRLVITNAISRASAFYRLKRR